MAALSDTCVHPPGDPGQIRVVTRRDTPQVRRLLDQRPIDNISLAARVAAHGVERTWLGNDLVGYFEDDHLVSLVSDGFSLHPVSATPAALDAFSQRLGRRRCASIVGVRDEVMGLWTRLCQASFTQWSAPREVRDHQRVMAVWGPTRVRPDPRLGLAGPSCFDSYHQASVAMYTEEVGVAPIDPQGAYRSYVASLVMRGLAFCLVVGPKVVFKTDIVATAGQICQLGGVWLTPELRGRGLSEPLMAAVVAHCQRRYPVVCLYVNAHNRPAIGCYQGVGFTQVSECATILY